MLKPVKIAAAAVAVGLIRSHDPLKIAAAFGIIGYFATSIFIPRMGESFKKVGLLGRDLSKPPPNEPIPEAMGAVAAITYIVLIVLIIPLVFFKYLVSFLSISNDEDVSATYNSQYLATEHSRLFPHNKLAEFLSGTLCLLSTILLGFFDDLFDIRWRHKFFLPAIASLPLLIVYYVDFSVTSIVVPGFVTKHLIGECCVEIAVSFFLQANSAVTYVTGLRFTTLAKDYDVSSSPSPKLLDLGIFYYAYMSALSIFSPNSINILAGINGLEVGQSVVLGIVFLLNDLVYLASSNVSRAATDSHMISAIFILPFLGVSLGLLQFNFYPARVFVGDTYCYFSGMVFAVVAILGHFSKTLLLFMLPQILNFIYSIPQLFNVLPCPRHRLPKFNPKDNKMSPSYGEITKGYGVGVVLLRILECFKLIELERDEAGNVRRFSNMTLINLILVWFGPMREDTLCLVILGIQFLVGILMIYVRHTIGPWLFGYDNLNWAPCNFASLCGLFQSS